jgi:hypothetical protein
MARESAEPKVGLRRIVLPAYLHQALADLQE